jgi:NADH-quinone oxidoreductase subunit H
VRPERHPVLGGFLPPLNIDLIPWFDIPGILWLLLKMSIFFFIFGWVRATVPRYRYDQLMRSAGRVSLPLCGWLSSSPSACG